MQREIKFKAWDKRTESVREVVKIDFSGSEWNVMLKVPKRLAPNHWTLRTFDEVMLLQFTGLYDRWGSEIWGGEKIRCFINDPVQEIVETVEWHKGCFWAGDVPLAYYADSEYENKCELLKE